jgi:hypothetical protein
MKYQDFLIDFLAVDDLRKLIEMNLVLHISIKSSRDVEVFEDFIGKIDEKIGKEFIENSLKLESSDGLCENIFCYLIKSRSIDAKKLENFLKIIQTYLNPQDIYEMFKNTNKNLENILQISIQTGDIQKLKIIWPAVQKLTSSSDFI